MPLAKMKVFVFIGTNEQECNETMKRYLFTYSDIFLAQFPTSRQLLPNNSPSQSLLYLFHVITFLLSNQTRNEACLRLITVKISS